MSVRESSLEVYYNQVKPNVSHKQAEIYKFFLDGNAYTNKELRRITGWEINSITPRTKELVDLGFLFEWKDPITSELRRSIHPQGQLF